MFGTSEKLIHLSSSCAAARARSGCWRVEPLPKTIVPVNSDGLQQLPHISPQSHSPKTMPARQGNMKNSRIENVRSNVFIASQMVDFFEPKALVLKVLSFSNPTTCDHHCIISGMINSYLCDESIDVQAPS